VRLARFDHLISELHRRLPSAREFVFHVQAFERRSDRMRAVNGV
jgi:hypothetical protein